MDQRAGNNRPALSFSIDNILRDDFAKSAKERAPCNTIYSPRVPKMFRCAMAACNECYSARYRPVYFYTTTSTLADKESMLDRASSQLNYTRKSPSSSNEQERAANQSRSSVNNKSTTPNTCCTQQDQSKSKQDTSTKAGEKKKRFRSHFSQLQLQYLESIFARQHYLSRDERTLLANALEMTELQVRNWFQNKRYQKRHREIQALQKVGKQVPVKILVAERGHVAPTLGVRPGEMHY